MREMADNRYTSIFEQVGDWWIGHVEELPGCNVQESTLEEARESLKEAVQLIVQANRELASLIRIISARRANKPEGKQYWERLRR